MLRWIRGLVEWCGELIAERRAQAAFDRMIAEHRSAVEKERSVVVYRIPPHPADKLKWN